MLGTGLDAPPNHAEMFGARVGMVEYADRKSPTFRYSLQNKTIDFRMVIFENIYLSLFVFHRKKVASGRL